jgi:hypothetical protein
MKNKLNPIHLLLVAAIAFTSVLSSCKKEIDITIPKDFDNIEFTVPASPTAINGKLASKDVTTNIEELAKARGFDISKIKSAKITAISFTINDPNATPVNFDIVDNIEAHLTSTNAPDIKIGNKSLTHNGATEASLDLADGVDVAPYIKQNTFTYTINGKTNAPIPHDVPMTAKLHMEFVVPIVQ